MVNKKTSEQIKGEILHQLKSGPKTITEISELINSNWLTTEKFLKDLEENKQVIEAISSPKMKVYIRADDPTYYNLPFPEEIRNGTIYLLSQVVKLWKIKNGNYPNKTTVQKIAVEVIRDCELNLPILEFHYGKVTCMNVSYNSDLVQIYDIAPPQNHKKIDDCINKILKENQHTGKSYDERSMQYNKEGMKFYSEKEKFIKNFIDEFSDKDKAIKSLIELSVNFPMRLDEYYSDFNEFVSTFVSLLSINSSNINSFNLKETFFCLWDLITTALYFKDASKFILPQKRELFEQIKNLNLSFKKMGYENLFAELKSELISIDESKLKFPEDNELKEVQKLFLESLD